MTCSFNEWAAAPDLMKSGEHVSMLLDKTPVCLSGPVSQLLLMRPRCHSDHTYCRLLLNLFPRPLETHTHTHLYRQTHSHSQVPSSLRAPTATRRLFPTHPTCFGVLPSFQSVRMSRKSTEATVCGNTFIRIPEFQAGMLSGMCRGHWKTSLTWDS